ncbi:hypothetical protein XENOCAPTIV_000443 [Xenoophorus captivus]|uniref:Uncharacterized protein n=1 Tax=Xenoophorus captivus TaxID=1517983 RepID=A0ABV0RAS5_9TELE
MVVGSSGPSQFQLTNAILGKEVFSTDVTSISASVKNKGELSGRPVGVVNGPNMYDKDITHVKRRMELRRSKCLCIPGPHAFLIAFDIEKISPNDMKTPWLLKKRFGANCLKHCMVLFAYEGNLDGASLENRVKKTEWYLRELIEKYGGRFHVFKKDWRDRSQDKELLRKIELMVASLGGGHFSCRTFQMAEDSVRKEEKRLRKQRAVEIERTWNEMEQQYMSEELCFQKDVYIANVRAEIQAKAELDNGWLRTSLARGLALVCAMEKTHKAVVSAIEDKQKKEEQRVQMLIKDIMKEIEQLKNHMNQHDPQVDQTDKLKQVVLVSEVPDHPTRFDRVANVLAKEAFSSGRCYWQVEVGNKIEWNLGIARQSINRKGKFTVCPANGFWTLSLKVGGQYVANTSPVTVVALEQQPRNVAVFLDYNEGRVSFYCAESGVHIYTFTDRFTDRLRPIFSPGHLHGGKNAAPLIITSGFCSI